MAGTYPDAVAQRLAYDIDGTVLLDMNITEGTSVVLGLTAKETLNNENSDYLNYTTPSDRSLAFIFPEPIDIAAYVAYLSATYSPSPLSIKWIAATATNQTTDGFNGDWVTLGSYGTRGTTVSPDYRAAPVSASMSNATALRFDFSVAGGYATAVTFYGIHLYADPHAGASRKLAFWHPTTDVEVGAAYFDFGDVGASTNATMQFRVKNLGALTASAMDLGVNVLTEGSPSVTSQHALSINNTTFTTSIRLRNSGDTADLTLATNEISPILYFKRTTDSAATLGPYSGRLHATATFF